MEKKEYSKPALKTKKIEAVVMSPSSGHDHGQHHGWDNPHNPHYPGNQEEDEP